MTVHVEINPNWAMPLDRSDLHRRQIRMAMAEKLFLGQEAPNGILDLGNPRPLRWASISHCPQGGGFAWSDEKRDVGFDLEEISRISAAVVGRMSNPHEKEYVEMDAPAVWVAKEASFKAVSHLPNINTISDIRLEIDSSPRRTFGRMSPSYTSKYTFRSFLFDPSRDSAAPPKTLGDGFISIWNNCIFSVFLGLI